MGNLPEPHLNKAAGPAFVTVRQAVDLLAEAHGTTTSAAAELLIDMFNNAVHEGRPALFEKDGPARKAVADPGERYVAVVMAVDALRKGPPVDDRRYEGVQALRARYRARGLVYRSSFEEHHEIIAELDRMEVRAAEFREFAWPAASAEVPNESAKPQVAGSVTHLTGRRKNPLAAVFARAKAEATDEKCPHSVWASLVALPSGPNPPPELGEYRCASKRIKAAGARDGWLSKNAFMDRWRRGKV